MRLSSDLHTGAKAHTHTQSRWAVTGSSPPSYKLNVWGDGSVVTVPVKRTHVYAEGHGGPPVILATEGRDKGSTEQVRSYVSELWV